MRFWLGGDRASEMANAVGGDIRAGFCAMLITPFPQLVLYIGFTLSLFAAISVASLFYFRRQPGWHKTRMVSFC